MKSTSKRGNKPIPVEQASQSGIEYSSHMDDNVNFETFENMQDELPFSELNEMEDEQTTWDDTENEDEYMSIGSYKSNILDDDDDDYVDPENCIKEYEKERTTIKDKFDTVRFGSKIAPTFMPYDDLICEEPYLSE